MTARNGCGEPAPRVGRQRAVLTLVLVAVAVLGTAFAMRPASVPAPAPDSAAQSVTTRTVETSAPAETSRAIVATAAASAAVHATRTPKPATPKRRSPAPGVKTIVVDKSEQRVTLYKADGKPVDTFRCSSGVIYPRVGTYKVTGHDPQSWALADDTTFYYFTKFAKSDKDNNIGFHANPQNRDGSVVGKIGKPISHGCVRLDKDDVRFVFTWAAAGTKVIVKP